MGVIRGGKIIEGASRRLSVIRATISPADFTDGGGTSGTYAMPEQVPAGANYSHSRCTVTAAFSGDTTAVIIIGDGSDTDRYNTGTPSIFTTGDKDLGVASGTKYHTAAATVTVTVTSGSDFGLLSAVGVITVELWFWESA